MFNALEPCSLLYFTEVQSGRLAYVKTNGDLTMIGWTATKNLESRGGGGEVEDPTNDDADDSGEKTSAAAWRNQRCTWLVSCRQNCTTRTWII
jgi:hypothetical protein